MDKNELLTKDKFIAGLVDAGFQKHVSILEPTNITLKYVNLLGANLFVFCFKDHAFELSHDNTQFRYTESNLQELINVATVFKRLEKIK